MRAPRLVALTLAALVCLLAATARAKISPEEWDKAVAGLKQAFARHDADAFGRHLQSIARDNSTRAVEAIFQALDQAQTLDVYDGAVLLLSRITDQEARARLMKLAEGASDWRVRHAALEAVARWSGGEALVLKSLEEGRAPLRRLAMRLVGTLGLVQGVDRMIAMLVATEKTARDSVEARDLREGLAQVTGQTLDSGAAYKKWWDELDFVGKAEALAGTRDKEEKEEKAAPQPEGEGGSVAPAMEWIKRQRRQDWRYLTTRQKGDILVVPGIYDQVQNVLNHLGIQHTIVARRDLGQTKLDPGQILIFNCDSVADGAFAGGKAGKGGGMLGPGGMPQGWQGPPGGLPPGMEQQLKNQMQQMMPYRFPDEVVRSIRRFVSEGGYLFTSDWELANVLSRAFPEYVSVAGSTGEHHYPIREVAENAAHPLLRGVFRDNPYSTKSFKWKIDGGSFLIGLKSPRVIPLIWSDALKKTYNNGYVGITFAPLALGSNDKGLVLHVLSHFQKQYSGEDDSYALQKMLLNFICQKQTWRRAEAKKK